VFRALADRMDQIPELKVRMFLNVQRRHRDTTMESEILREFANKFKMADWPGSRLPEVFYDPRSLDMDANKRSSMHAKSIVVDRKQAFVSSANFTEAAQARNIEVGVLIRSERFAERLVEHFEALATIGLLARIEGL